MRLAKGNTLVHAERTDVGRRRAANQDSMQVLPPAGAGQFAQRGWLFVVADGMGAHAAGERASAIAAERVPALYEQVAPRSPALAMRKALESVNQEIHAAGKATPELEGMGTTCTALAILPRGAVIGHIGDSRAYRIRKGTIDQLTRDHSLVWELEAAAGMTAEQAAGAAPKNIITRSMGPHAAVEADLEGPHPIEEGDVFLLSSDGLTGQVADEEIGLFAGVLEPREAAEALVGLTLVRGAPDNVTILVARAGPGEVSRVSSTDRPWLLSDEAAGSGRTQVSIPWIPLLIAAACLFAGLAAFSSAGAIGPESAAPPAAGEGDSATLLKMLSGTVLLFTAGILVLWSFLSGIAGKVRVQRVLLPGQRVGKGPYRTSRCHPTPELLEGVLASVESAGDGLRAEARRQAAELLAEARSRLAGGRAPSKAGAGDDPTVQAVQAVKRALDLHRQAFERARLDVTVAGSAGPSRDG
jgi:serine/threonine protein phosphatase PrpC